MCFRLPSRIWKKLSGKLLFPSYFSSRHTERHIESIEPIQVYRHVCKWLCLNITSHMICGGYLQGVQLFPEFWTPICWCCCVVCDSDVWCCATRGVRVLWLEYRPVWLWRCIVIHVGLHLHLFSVALHAADQAVVAEHASSVFYVLTVGALITVGD